MRMPGKAITIPCIRCGKEMLYFDREITAVTPYRFDRIYVRCITENEWETYWRDMGWDPIETKKAL